MALFKIFILVSPVILLAESKPTILLAESKPTILLAESKPTSLLAESKLTSLLAESKPTSLLALSKPNQQSIYNPRRGKGFFSDVFEEVYDTAASAADDVYDAGNSAYDAYDDFRQVYSGPDGECGKRRSVFCYATLTGIFTGCAAVMNPAASFAFAMSANSCFGGQYNVLKRCRECIRDVCEATMGPLGKDQYCDEMKTYIEQNIYEMSKFTD